jgi:DNA-binding FadR family transcriptional regulator
MANQNHSSEFLEYLSSHIKENPVETRLPSLNELSSLLDISVARLREQLEVAKTLGLVEVRPRTGIKNLPYSFYEAAWQSLSFAIGLDHSYFHQFASLRRHIELAYWYEAVEKLTSSDHEALKELMAQAWKKLSGKPPRVPHEEHRELHLLIFCHLENPFVLGVLECYWSAYEAIGLSLYTDINYLEEVWTYHQKMVDAICIGDFKLGYQSLEQHTDLLLHVLGREGE